MNDPTNGAATLPGPLMMVTNTISPDTVQLTMDSGSTWPSDIAISAPPIPVSAHDITYLMWIASSAE